jgi:hypothetical protein
MVKEKIWFVVGALRAEDNIVFERATDTDSLLFDFFVPSGLEVEFLQLMGMFERRGCLVSLEALPNRLARHLT